MSQTDRKFHTGVFQHFTITTPARAARFTSCIATATDGRTRCVYTCGSVCFTAKAAESAAEGRTRGRDPGRREQKKTTWHIPHIHFTPVKCDSCEARCPPPPMRAGANATSAAIISYSPAADVGKRVGLVWIPPHPYAGTSFDTGHLPAHPPPPPPTTILLHLDGRERMHSKTMSGETGVMLLSQ